MAFQPRDLLADVGSIGIDLDFAEEVNFVDGEVLFGQHALSLWFPAASDSFRRLGSPAPRT